MNIEFLEHAANTGTERNGTERKLSHAQLHDEPHPFTDRAMELGFVLLILCFQSLLLRSVSADPSGTRCPSASGREETCVCQTDGGIIDLTPFSNTDGTPRYGMVMSTSLYIIIVGPPNLKGLPVLRTQYVKPLY